MQQSAIATGKVFGVPSFSKSTISRNIKSMEEIINECQIDSPLSIEESQTPPSVEIISRVTELLEKSQSIDSLIDACNVKAGKLPPPIKRVSAISAALSRNPKRLLNVYKNSDAAGEANAAEEAVSEDGVTGRKAPERQAEKKTPYEENVQPKKELSSKKNHPEFVPDHEIRKIRLEFIAVCKANILDAVIRFHRFLI
jgi:hypothetical protein